MAQKILFLFAGACAASALVAYLKKQKRFRTSLHRKYFLSLVNLIIIILCAAEAFEAVNPAMDLPTVLLRSSALLVAILGFAAQPVIMNIICGLLISFQKPFEIGDRIIVEGQEPGIVEDITLRHTVIRIYDGLKIIIPNGELNSKTVTNFSYGMKDRRGIHLRYSVSYDTDVRKAMDIIRDCVAASPYTLSIETDGICEDSGPVYFLEYGDSDLVLRTTIWVARETNSYKAVTDINIRVLEAFNRNGIEIPYSYLNVVEYAGSKAEPAVKTEGRSAPSAMRYRRTDNVQIAPGENGLQKAIETADKFAEQQCLSEHTSMQLELLTEESLGLIQRIMEQTWRDFWIEGTGKVFRIHLRASVHINSLESYQKLIEISSSRRNEAASSINARIMEAFLIGRRRLLDRKKGGDNSFDWQLSDAEASEDEIGKSILGKLASDVRICVREDWVELVVLKTV